MSEPGPGFLDERELEKFAEWNRVYFDREAADALKCLTMIHHGKSDSEIGDMLRLDHVFIEDCRERWRNGGLPNFGPLAAQVHALRTLRELSGSLPAPAYESDEAIRIDHDPQFDGSLPDHPIQGRLLGENFRAHNATVIIDGTIEILQGDFSNFPLNLVTIRMDLNKEAEKTVENKTFDIRITGDENYSQYISLSLRPTPEANMTMETFREYRLSLRLGEKRDLKIPLEIYLALPDENRSVLAGMMEADVREVIRYRAGTPNPEYPPGLSADEGLLVSAMCADPLRMGEFIQAGGDVNAEPHESHGSPLEELADNWRTGEDDEDDLSMGFNFKFVSISARIRPDNCRACAELLLEAGAKITDRVRNLANEKSTQEDLPKTALLEFLKK